MKYILIKGAGDIATGTLVKLRRSGFNVGALELMQPTAIRRTVSFSEAVFGEPVVLEGVEGCHCETLESFIKAMSKGEVPIFTGPKESLYQWQPPQVFIEATLSKVNKDTSMEMADLVIGLGPGFTAGLDVHAVIETMRGHNLGRIITQGSAQPDTGIPGDIGGHTILRVLRSGAEGIWRGCLEIGERVMPGDCIGWIETCDGVIVKTYAEIQGILRGQLRSGLHVHGGMKVADIDPRAEREHCYSISDKARAIAGGVLECVLWHESRFGKKD